MKEILPYIYAILAGVFAALEATINAKLGEIVPPEIATMHDLILGIILIAFVNILMGTLTEYPKVFNVNLQWLLGGIFGALMIYLVIITIPQLGLAITLTIVVASQILSGLYIDTFIFKQQQLDSYKILGALLVIAGVFFITMDTK